MRRIRQRDTISFFIFLIFIKPGFVEDISILDNIWNAGRFGLTIVFVFILLCSKSPKRMRVLSYTLIIFLACLISTCMHQGIIATVLAHWIPVMGMIAWFEIHRKDIRNIIPVFYKNGGILVIANLISILLFPHGMWMRNTYTSVWILGQKQDFISCLLTTAFFGLLTYYWNRKQGRFFYVILACIAATLVISKPVGLIACLMIIAMLIFVEKVLKRNLNMRMLIAIDWIAELGAIGIAFAYERLTGLQAVLAGLTNTGMDKATTMGIRFRMWTYALTQLKTHPALGLGQVNEDMWYRTSNLDFYHTIVHNLPLDIALVGGGIALSVFVIWTLAVARRLHKAWGYQEARYIGIFLFAFLIICITECPYQPMTMLFLAYPFWVDFFIEPKNRFSQS